MNITITERLRELGYTLPPVPKPLAAYIPAIRAGKYVMTAGQLPLGETGLTTRGIVGAEVGMDEAVQAARVATLNCLAAAGSVAGGVDNITKIIKITVYVASTPGFYDQPKVANGASELLALVFAGSGAHIRSAVGVASLPMNAPVEIELVCEIDEEKADAPQPHRAMGHIAQ